MVGEIDNWLEDEHQQEDDGCQWDEQDQANHNEDEDNRSKDESQETHDQPNYRPEDAKDQP